MRKDGPRSGASPQPEDGNCREATLDGIRRQKA